MNRIVVVSLVLAAHTAAAEARHVLVLRAEGNADAGARAKIDTQVLKLAKNIEGNVEAGDINFTDTAAAVGCNPTEPACRDEVLSTMGVDEVVAVTVTAGPGGELKVSVRRMSKGSPVHEASTAIPPGQAPDAKLNAEIGPLFGVAAAADKHAGSGSPAGSGGAAASTGTANAKTDPRTDTKPPRTEPTQAESTHTAPPARTAQAGDTVTAAPNGQITDHPEDRADHRQIELIGLGVGGGLVALSFIMWAEANSIQGDISNAPTRSPTDFRNLRDLESRGDSYSSAGNVMFVGGLAIGAISGYFFWRDRHRVYPNQQARVAPAVFEHGAGLTFTVGGAP